MPNDLDRRPAPSDPLEDASRLQADGAHRAARGAFFVEGVRNVVHAIESGWRIESLIVSDRLLTVPIARRLVRERARAGTPCHAVTPEQFRGVSQAERASGVAAIVAQRWDRLHDVPPRAGLCWVALRAVRSPGNLGTLVRSADAVGAAGFILLSPSLDPFEPAVIRGSMGAVFRQRFVRTRDVSFAQWVRRRGCHVVGASPDGTHAYHRIAYPAPTVLLLGEERSGLAASDRSLCERLVRIPMRGHADSLNLAVAGSLLLFEVARWREDGRPRERDVT